MNELAKPTILTTRTGEDFNVLPCLSYFFLENRVELSSGELN